MSTRKQICLAHGCDVLKMSLLHKDELRKTTLARHGGKKVQGDMFTSHASPKLQAVIHEHQEHCACVRGRVRIVAACGPATSTAT